MATVPLVRIHAPNEIKTDHVASPGLGEQDVLVAVQRCGICGSDLSYAKLGGIPGAASPFALGHEFSGVVAEVGAGVQSVAVGDRVVVNPEAGGNGIGSDGLSGAFSPAVVYRNAVEHPEGLLKLPDFLDFDHGALVEPLSVGMHGVNQAAVQPGDRVLVFGAGPVGVAAGIAALYKGAKDVVLTDLSEKRLELAAHMGMSTFLAGSGELRDFLKAQHGVDESDPRLGPLPATDVIIEATGAGPVFQQALDIARKGARISVVGVHFAPVEMNMINLLMKELQIVGSMAYVDEFEAVLEMLSSGSVDVTPMIAHQFPLSRFADGFAVAQDQQQSLKVMIDCQA